MPLLEAIRALNQMRRGKALSKYVVIGAVAYALYEEPISTGDLDILIEAKDDEHFLSMWNLVRQRSKGVQGMHLIIGDVPVQMFPTSLSPLHKATLDGAKLRRIDNIRVLVAPREYLILLYLNRFSDLDRYRIKRLLRHVREGDLERLLRRFDGTLTARLRDI